MKINCKLQKFTDIFFQVAVFQIHAGMIICGLIALLVSLSYLFIVSLQEISLRAPPLIVNIKNMQFEVQIAPKIYSFIIQCIRFFIVGNNSYQASLV